VARIRRLGAVALATPLAIGLTVIGVTAPAQAESGITSPAETVTHGGNITVSAKVDNVVRAELQVAPPGAGYTAIASGGNLLGSTRLSNRVDLTRNGVYQVRLKGSLTGTVYDAQSFAVRIPPAAPSDLRSSVAGKKVALQWARGTEADLTGYQVAASGVTARAMSTGAVCSGAACAATLTLPAGVTGQAGVYVRALRADGSGGTVKSSISSSRVAVARPATGTTMAAPGVTPTAGAAGLPGTPPAAPLNPLQSNSPITLPSVTPQDATPGFQYPAPIPEVAMPAQSPPNAKNVSATSGLQWGKSLAVALILLIIAAHLGTWTRRTRIAEAVAGGAGRKAGGRAQRKAKAEATSTPADTTAAMATTTAATPETKSETKPTGGRRSAAKASGRHGNGGYRGRRRAL
jgi:hypothetical protein